MRKSTSSPNFRLKTICLPAERWRPSSHGPECGHTFRGKTCSEHGAHYCEGRADRVVAFFAERLVHTKGRWARKAFILSDWQEREVVRPLFGEVEWSAEWGCYRRRYRLAYIILGRKNGKSELAAGIVLYLLVGDDEEAAEVYGAAKDTKQAGKVGAVVLRMMQLSPALSARLDYRKNERRIFDDRTGSFYEIITSDAEGELGANPHGFVLDEALSQTDDALWNAMITGFGTRVQPLALLISTETNEPVSFGAQRIDEAERIQEKPSRAPHAFAYVRKTPTDADPWNEGLWSHANPALGDFLMLSALKVDALEANNDPTKENAFRQFRLNQRVSQATRHMPLHLWDACGREVLDRLEQACANERCFVGIDLSSTTDLTALSYLFPRSGTEDDPHRVLWRFFLPEACVGTLDSETGGKLSVWARSGLINLTDGDWIEYDAIREQILQDRKQFRFAKVGYDEHQAADIVQWLEKHHVECQPVRQGYALSSAIGETMRLVKSKGIEHGGHPVARWCVDSVEVKHPADDPDVLKIIKPDRRKSRKRIDGYAALLDSVFVMMHAQPERVSLYEERGLELA